MWILVGILAGIAVGAGLVYVLLRARRTSEQEMKDAFANLSQQSLQANADQVLRLAKEVLSAQTEAAKQELAGNKKLIDQNLEAMGKRLAELHGFLQKTDRDREGSHKALSAQLENAAQETSKLRQTAEQLTAALASPQHRGQWGERMAEDVLRVAGFVEGINYVKQQQAEAGTRPDFTFPLPNGLHLNMDVKFPLANYLRFLEADSDPERQRYGKAFIGDVRNRIKEVASRDYIDPQHNTVNYALVFIPNEQVYASIHEIDPSVLDEALKRRIVLCSPLTLYAMLAVIRQAAENVAMERRAFEMANLINGFVKQWDKFKEELTKLGSQLETVQRTYGRLTTTRINQLEKPIDKIDDLRSARAELAPAAEDTALEEGDAE
jgi:DNA recombination protein RmuC